MTQARRVMVAATGIGLLWAVLVVWAGLYVGAFRAILPRATLANTMSAALFPGGLVMATVFGSLILRRLHAGESMGGADFPPGSAGDIDRRVLSDTALHLVLALAIWPISGAVSGLGVPVALGLALAPMLGLYWLGCHRSVLLRNIGFAGSFYPTVVAGLVVIGDFAT